MTDTSKRNWIDDALWIDKILMKFGYTGKDVRKRSSILVETIKQINDQHNCDHKYLTEYTIYPSFVFVLDRIYTLDKIKTFDEYLVSNKSTDTEKRMGDALNIKFMLFSLVNTDCLDIPVEFDKPESPFSDKKDDMEIYTSYQDGVWCIDVLYKYSRIRSYSARDEYKELGTIKNLVSFFRNKESEIYMDINSFDDAVHAMALDENIWKIRKLQDMGKLKKLLSRVEIGSDDEVTILKDSGIVI